MPVVCHDLIVIVAVEVVRARVVRVALAGAVVVVTMVNSTVQQARGEEAWPISVVVFVNIRHGFCLLAAVASAHYASLRTAAAQV